MVALPFLMLGMILKTGTLVTREKLDAAGNSLPAPDGHPAVEIDAWSTWTHDGLPNSFLLLAALLTLAAVGFCIRAAVEVGREGPAH